MKRRLFGFFSGVLILGFTVGATDGFSWDRALYKEWEQSYLKSTDLELVVRIQETENPFKNRIYRKILLPASCEAIYEVQRVERQPLDLGILPGDRIFLKYRCGAEGEYKGPERTLPWIHVEGDGLFRIKMRASSIEKKRRSRWIVNNQGWVFSPVP